MSQLPESVVLEDRPCPNHCAGQDRLIIEAGDRLHGLPGKFKVVQCGHCGLMRTNPRPSAATIGAYYPADYGPYSSPPPVAKGRRPLVRRLVSGLFSTETRKMPPLAPGKLLEIGCAHGAYLAEMREAGWTVEGIEFSEEAAQRARARGLQVRTGTVENATPPAQPVDVVAAWMVLEHLHEPLAALRKIRQWLKPSGYLIASVPDANALERRFFGERWYALQLPTHLYHYTPASIAILLRNAGWELERVSWQRNCNNLLCSLEYLARDKTMPRLLASVRWLRTARRAAPFRRLLNWLVGVTRQSGRMEIWARPLQDSGQAK